MKRLVAVKILPTEMVHSEQAVKRFQREAEVAARLSHANIVQAHDAGQQHGLHYLVMEFVEGIDLVALVRERGPLPVDEAVNYVLQAAQGLAYAHGEGIVHRDIKPGNLLLDKYGKVKILDMGLARIDAPGEGVNLTRTGEMMGTPDYMAPEQALDTRSADSRADVYSLGCTLFRLLTGVLPYAGETYVQMLMAHCEAPIPDLRAKRPDTPEPLKAIFDRMVAKQPEDRYQSMTDVIADLQAFQRGEKPSLGVGVRSQGSGSTQARSASEGSKDQDVGVLMGPSVSTAVELAKPQTAGLEETVGYTRAKEETGKPDAPASSLTPDAGIVPGQVAASGSKTVVYVLVAVGLLVAVGVGAAFFFAFGGG
jgi:serine/threonine protein kinase